MAHAEARRREGDGLLPRLAAEVDPVHNVLTRLFLGGQVRGETCWKYGEEIDPILEKCAVCGTDSLSF